MSEVLVAGGAGFIGSHLVKTLLKKNNVFVVDNFITGKKQNIQEFLPEIRLIEKDIVLPLKELDNTKFSEIYCLASPASPKDYQSFPLKTILSNSIGVKNLLDLTKKSNALFFLASTSEVYGDPLVHPQKEYYWGNVNPFGPRSCYDEAKRFAESIVYTYKEKFGVEARIARIFNTYGPKMSADDGRVVPNFIVQALKGVPLTIYGKGKQTRSFCFVSDMVDGITKLMKSSYDNPVNLGNPNEITILELAETILRFSNSNSGLEYLPLPQDDPLRRQPDISTAKKEIEWEPKVSLEEGLNKTIKWFKKII